MLYLAAVTNREEAACWEEEVQVLSQSSVQSLHNGSRGLYRLVQGSGGGWGEHLFSFMGKWRLTFKKGKWDKL